MVLLLSRNDCHHRSVSLAKIPPIKTLQRGLRYKQIAADTQSVQLFPQFFRIRSSRFVAMDGKAKKRLEVIRQKLPQLKQQLAGAKKQMDDVEEVRKLEKEIAALEAEATKLRA
jgi:hypothetical protein